MGRTATTGPILGGAVLALWVVPVLATAQGAGEAATGATSVWLWFSLAVIGLIVLNSVYVAGDTAFDSLRPLHAKMAESDPHRASLLEGLLKRQSQLVATCFIASHTMRSLMILACLLPAEGVGRWMAESTPLGPGTTTTLLAAVLVSLPVAALNLVFGELIPKTLGAKHPATFALRLHRFVIGTAWVFAIPAALVTGIGGLITRRFGARASFAVQNEAEEQIRELLQSGEEAGEIPLEEKTMVHSVFEFGDTVAREVMTPRVDLDALPVASSLEDAIEIIERSGHSRIPVYERSFDEIVGIIHAKDVLRAISAQEHHEDMSSLMRAAEFVPENKPIRELLNELRVRRTQMVIVQDEFGGTAGVVTIEDIVEEVMGEIVDEYDAEEPGLLVAEGGGWFVKGKENLYDVNEQVGSEFESDEFDTVGGYVFGLFGRQPSPGESIEDSGWRFTVQETDGRRIVELHVEKMDQEPLEADERTNVGSL